MSSMTEVLSLRNKILFLIFIVSFLRYKTVTESLDMGETPVKYFCGPSWAKLCFSWLLVGFD